jgi:hypothetical protein
LMLRGISSFVCISPLWPSERVVVSSPSPSETSSKDTVFNTTPSFWCCTLGSFRTLTLPCESPVK